MRRAEAAAGMGRGMQHFVTYPFRIADPDVGGLPAVFANEISGLSSPKDVTFITADAASQEWNQARIKAAPREPAWSAADQIRLEQYWFSTGCWSWLHPAAHTKPGVGDRVLEGLYPPAARERLQREMHGAALPEVGSLEYLLLYADKFAPNPAFARRFNQRFERLFASVVVRSAQESREHPRAVVQYTDFMFIPLVIAKAEALRNLDVYQTYHLHTPMPDSLCLSAWGRSLLQAVSMVDAVFVLTEDYAVRLKDQLKEMRLRIPEIECFKLGVCPETLARQADEFHPSNFMQDYDGFAALSDDQQGLLKEVFLTRGKIPHRFICVDRADPGKGVAALQDAIEKFLADTGLSPQDCRERYRFFFVHSAYPAENPEPTNLKQCYAAYLQKRHQELQARFPGVIWVAPAYTGPQSGALIASIMKDCHIMTGGAQDGLNLTVLENAVINTDLNTAVLAGCGAGIAAQARTAGYGHCGFFPEAGNTDQFVEALRSIVAGQAKQGEVLRQQKAPLVEYFESRRDSVIVDPP